MPRPPKLRTILIQAPETLTNIKLELVAFGFMLLSNGVGMRHHDDLSELRTDALSVQNDSSHPHNYATYVPPSSRYPVAALAEVVGPA